MVQASFRWESAMRDLVLSLLIGTTIIVGATETVGLTKFLEGQDPSSAVRRAVHDMGVPDLPAMPDISMPDPRSFFPPSVAASPSPTPAGDSVGAPLPDVKTMYIARTNGAGVRARPTCADANVGQTGVAEGAAVEFIRAGGGDCPGWGLVRSGGLEFWVRMAYLDASPPKASAPLVPGAPVAAPAPPVGSPGAPPKAEPAQPEQANSHGKPAEKGEKPVDPGKPEATPAVTPTTAPTTAPTPTPTSTATSTPTAVPTSPTPTPLPNLPPEDEQ